MILFLDFDGVLHPLNDRDTASLETTFSCAPHLWQILRRHPELRVVISSSWRHRHSLAELARLVTANGGEDLAGRFIGVTPDLPERPEALDYKHRRLESEAWLADNAWTGPWIAIDDMIKLWGFPESQNVYIVDYRHGLRPHDVEAVAARIRKLVE